MKCRICGGSKKTASTITVTTVEERRVPCNNPYCLNGWHAMHYIPGKSRVDRPSNVVQHGIKGRALCPLCEGRKCRNCRYTGFLVRPCVLCHGTGVQKIVVKSETRTQGGEEKPCLYCLPTGQEGRIGTLGEVLQAALEACDDNVNG